MAKPRARCRIPVGFAAAALLLLAAPAPARAMQDELRSPVAVLIDEARRLQNSRPAESAALAGAALERLGDGSAPALRIEAMAIVARALSRTGDYEGALGLGQAAVALAETAGISNTDLAMALDAIGQAVQRMGRIDEAYHALQRAYEIRRELGLEAETVTSLVDIATLESLGGEHDRARETFMLALPRAEALGLDSLIGRIFVNIAYGHIEQGEPDKALEAVGRARQIALELDNPMLIAHSFHNTGEALVDLGRLDEAEPYLLTSLDYSRDGNLRSVTGDNYFHLGRIALARGELDLAAEHAGRAHEIATDIRENARLRDITRLQFEIARGRGDTAGALARLEAHLAFKDAVFNRESDRRRALLSAQFDLSAKADRIALLEREGEIRNLHIAQGESRRSLYQIGIALTLAVIAFLLYGLQARIASSRALADKARELSAARDQLAEAGRAKSNLLATTSHEVRTPLNGMLGMAQLLLETDLDARQRDYAGAILAAGGGLLTVLNDILDFSRLEAGQVDIRPADFPIRPLISVQKPLWDAQAREKSLDFTLDIADDVPECLHTDPDRLRQVLFNLVGNAIKFTNSGDVRLRLSVETGEAGSRHLLIEVVDSGIGIPDDVQEQIFRPYHRGRLPGDGSYGGTGLGLHICREFVGRMGGEIGVESRPGEGSRFHVRLPLAEAQTEAQPEAAVPASARPAAALRILVAEDNAINQKLISAVLESWGHDYRIVENGKLAVEEVRTATYDLVLMDARMPEMGGIDATRAIRALGGAKARIPVIALTANALEGDAEAFARAGIDSHVSKPIDIAVLAAEIERLTAVQDAPAARTAGAR